jgi:hypothetical protein
MTHAAPVRPFALRRLTPGEQALAREVFGPGLDPARVRLLTVPLWSRPFAAGPRLLVWPAGAALADFSKGPLFLQSVFVHEMTHVWQAQAGTNLLFAKLRAGDSRAAYAYDLADGRAFEALNIEQQAMVVQHAFLASRGGAAPHPEAAYDRILAGWAGALGPARRGEAAAAPLRAAAPIPYRDSTPGDP